MVLPISIIIPTFNEEKYLPKLLRSVENQSVRPKEIIVADAFSIDNTRKIARDFGCKVVDGGLPAKARNNGGRVATCDLLLFLDADVILPKKFLEKTVEEMKAKKLSIASCFIKPLSSDMMDSVLHGFVNYYMRFTKEFHPHIPGFCIFVNKTLHEKINGFDESLYMAEDHDYVKRAERFGNFSYLNSYKIPISVRRLNKEGRLKLAVKYTAIELHLLLLGKVKRKIFPYEFGNHAIK